MTPLEYIACILYGIGFLWGWRICIRADEWDIFSDNKFQTGEFWGAVICGIIVGAIWPFAAIHWINKHLKLAAGANSLLESLARYLVMTKADRKRKRVGT